MCKQASTEGLAPVTHPQNYVRSEGREREKSFTIVTSTYILHNTFVMLRHSQDLPPIPTTTSRHPLPYQYHLIRSDRQLVLGITPFNRTVSTCTLVQSNTSIVSQLMILPQLLKKPQTDNISNNCAPVILLVELLSCIEASPCNVLRHSIHLPEYHDTG
ncbi:hypothetical protein CBL_07119 [Carabus blaptoides fortunei]